MLTNCLKEGRSTLKTSTGSKARINRSGNKLAAVKIRRGRGENPHQSQSFWSYSRALKFNQLLLIADNNRLEIQA